MKLFAFAERVNLKGVVVILCISGALGIAWIAPEQRNAFMTIAVTATGGFFGAEVPASAKAKLRQDDEDIEELEHKLNGNRR